MKRTDVRQSSVAATAAPATRPPSGSESRDSSGPLYFTVEEAASLLRVAPSTVYAWVHQRRLPYRKHGARLVFTYVDLAAWSEASKFDPLPDGYSESTHGNDKPVAPPREASTGDRRRGSLTTQHRDKRKPSLDPKRSKEWQSK